MKEKERDWKCKSEAELERGESCNPIVLDEGDDYDEDDYDDDDDDVLYDCPLLLPDEIENLFNGCKDEDDDADVKELWHCDGVVSREAIVTTTGDYPFEIVIDDSDEEEENEVPKQKENKVQKPKSVSPTAEMRAEANKHWFKRVSCYETHMAERKKYIENGVLKEQSTESLLFLHREKMYLKERKERRIRRSKSKPQEPLGLPLVKCRICGLILKRKSFAHTFEPGPEYASCCPACPAKDMNEPELIAHFRSVHFGDEEIKVRFLVRRTAFFYIFSFVFRRNEFNKN